MNNLKLCLLAVLTIFSFNVASGQQPFLEAGIEVGPSLVILRGNEAIRTVDQPALGFATGTFLQFNFGHNYALRSSISYERKGARTVYKVTDAVNNHVDKVIVRSNFDYLTLPILFRVHGGKKLRYFFNAGPFVGLLLQQTFVVKSELNPTTVEDNTANDLPFDFGISSGFGLSLPIQPTFALSLELRNNLGLANVSAAPIRNGGSIKTNSTNLLIGFSFGIGQAKE